MLEYDRIEVPEGIDVNNANSLCECIICHYWYFLNMNFKFQAEVYNGYYDLMQKATDFTVKEYLLITIVTVKE